ncbi:response regulator [Terriglobus roseus]|nr:response regulator [Terriglobus roseus]
MDIFVVDDERIIAETLAIILRNHGYSAETFFSAEHALASIGKSPRLLLTDFRMGRMSGIDLAMEAHSRIDCSVILFSSDLQECDREWQMLQKRDSRCTLLRKPLHPARLLQQVRLSLSTEPRLGLHVS